ncbi:unnamed protein product [Chrysoparadoxa australica]
MRIACFIVLFASTCCSGFTGTTLLPRPVPSRAVSSCRHQLPTRVVAALLASTSGEESGPGTELDNAPAPEQVAASAAVTTKDEEKVSWPKKLKNLVFGQKLDKNKLAEMGLHTLLSYGFVSNVSYVIMMSSAWFVSCKRTGLSPLAPGQWQPFLGVYMGFFILNNAIRPLRLALSVAISPIFEGLIAGVQDRFGLEKKKATALVVVFVNVFGTLSLFAGGITLASLLSGVALF